MITDQLDELRLSLRKVPAMTKVVGFGDDIIPLTDEEVLFLEGFCGEKQIAEVSHGVLEGSKARILSGPLVGKEGLIKKIDYHKRRAYLEMDMFGRRQNIRLGLEVRMEKLDKN